MLREDRVRDAEPLVQAALLQQGPGPVQGLLLRLADDEERAAPGVPGGGEERDRPGDGGDVQIVAAGVHDPGDGAGVRESGRLGHRQGVQFGAQQHNRPRAVVQHPDDPVAAAHGTGDRAPQLGEPGGEAAGGAALVAGEFGVGVQVEVQLDGGAEDGARQGVVRAGRVRRGRVRLVRVRRGYVRPVRVRRGYVRPVRVRRGSVRSVRVRRGAVRPPRCCAPRVPVVVRVPRRSRRCDHHAPHLCSTSLLRTAVTRRSAPLPPGVSEVTARERRI